MCCEVEVPFPSFSPRWRALSATVWSHQRLFFPLLNCLQFSSVQSLSRVRLLVPHGLQHGILLTISWPQVCEYTGFPGGPSGENPPASSGDRRDTASIPGSGRSLGEGNGDPLEYSCLENPMDREAWRATVRGVAHRQTRLKWLSMQHARVRAFLDSQFYSFGLSILTPGPSGLDDCSFVT